MAKLRPITRKEQYLAKAGGQSVSVPLPPITREEQFLKDIIDAIEAGGESSDYAVDIEFAMNSQTFVVTAQLRNKDGDLIGTPKSVDIPLESTVVNGSYNNATKTLTLTLVSGQSINIPIGDIISGLQTEITAQNPLNADLVADANSTHKFVTASEKAQIATNADGIANIDSKILLITDELNAKLPDKGNHTTINGIDVYVSNTQPTGTIRENSIGFGW